MQRYEYDDDESRNSKRITTLFNNIYIRTWIDVLPCYSLLAHACSKHRGARTGTAALTIDHQHDSHVLELGRRER
jgi:hypothetical protein